MKNNYMIIVFQALVLFYTAKPIHFSPASHIPAVSIKNNNYC